jgi:hypothetical protein
MDGAGDAVITNSSEGRDRDNSTTRTGAQNCDADDDGRTRRELI